MPNDYPKGFGDKSVMHQAEIKAALIRKKQLDVRMQTWQEKPQHGAFMRQMKEIGADMKGTFGWLKSCALDPFSEAYICAAQEMGIFTKFHEKNILHNSNDAACRICKKTDETIFHILSGCDSLAKR